MSHGTTNGEDYYFCFFVFLFYSRTTRFCSVLFFSCSFSSLLSLIRHSSRTQNIEENCQRAATDSVRRPTLKTAVFSPSLVFFVKRPRRRKREKSDSAAQTAQRDGKRTMKQMKSSFITFFFHQLKEKYGIRLFSRSTLTPLSLLFFHSSPSSKTKHLLIRLRFFCARLSLGYLSTRRTDLL